MTEHRELAIAAMQAETRQSIGGKDFMVQAGLAMPSVTITGSIPATLRTQLVQSFMTKVEPGLCVDLVLQWTLGDYPNGKEYSTYYDPKSPWYNVFFGSYAIRSYKPDGEAWGYSGGKPDFKEFLQIPKLDYNVFTAGQFGCPPDKMCFDVSKSVQSTVGGWDCLELDVCVPSGLHDPVRSLGKPESFVVYGIPSRELFSSREEFEKLCMHGKMYMCRIPQSRIDPRIGQPITLAFGGLCQDDAPSSALLDEIMTALADAYLPLGPGA
jgi:hypothetical protein